LRSCLRICKDKNFAADKDWRFHPSKSSSLQEAVLIMPGIPAGWSDLLVQSTKHLSQLYLILLKYQKKNLAD
jgi:hypothetical protein